MNGIMQSIHKIPKLTRHNFITHDSPQIFRSLLTTSTITTMVHIKHEKHEKVPKFNMLEMIHLSQYIKGRNPMKNMKIVSK